MSTALKFVAGLRLSVDLLMQPIALLGNRGSGKTYGGLKLFEEAHEAGVQCIWLDPVGKAFGLRLEPSGKPGGLKNVYIFGGNRGDFPLTEEKGAYVAKVLFESRVSAVLDVSLFRKGARKRFITDLLEELYHLAKESENTHPRVLFLEEAHTVIPQKPMKGDERMVGAVEDIVLLGRNAGLGVVLMDQRPAHVNKSCLAEVEALVALRTTYPIDRKVYRDWIAARGAAEIDFDEELPKLAKGEGFIWVPGENIFQKAHILERKTYDSSATVRIGSKRRVIAKLGKVDKESIAEQMEEVTAAAEKDDPAALRRKVAELEKQLAQRLQEAATHTQAFFTAKPKSSKPWPKASVKKLQKVMDMASRVSADMFKVEQDFKQTLGVLAAALAAVYDKKPSEVRDQYARDQHLQDARQAEKAARFGDRYSTPAEKMFAAGRASGQAIQRTLDENAKATKTEPDTESRTPVGKQITMLSALAACRSLSKKDLGLAVGINVNSTFRAYLSRLKRWGFVVTTGAKELMLSDAAHNKYSPLDMTWAALMDRNSDVLVGLQQKMVDELERQHNLTVQQLADLVGKTVTNSTFRAYVSRLKRRGLIAKTLDGGFELAKLAREARA